MKLQEVPTEILRESMLALADLRRKYRGEPMQKYASNVCPLCKFNDTFISEEDEGDCRIEKLCPWFWLENNHCNHRRTVFSQKIPDRLTRINRWEAKITAEIARRDHH